MKFASLVLTFALALASGVAMAEDKPKPAPKPAEKPKTPPPPPPKPQPSVKDIAIGTAKKYDANHNGKIEGIEVAELQNAYANEVKADKGYLYLFDDNGDKRLDEAEISKIELGPPPPPKPPAPKPGAKPEAKPWPKPTPKPPEKPKTPPPPKPLPPKPQPSMKEMAIAAAKKFDTNHNGKIDGNEVAELLNAYASELKANEGHLYLFDENRDQRLDDAEVAKIQLGPPPKPAAPKPDAKPDPKKTDPRKTDPRKK